MKASSMLMAMACALGAGLPFESGDRSAPYYRDRHREGAPEAAERKRARRQAKRIRDEARRKAGMK